jgi:hypothetical protein
MKHITNENEKQQGARYLKGDFQDQVVVETGKIVIYSVNNVLNLLRLTISLGDCLRYAYVF